MITIKLSSYSRNEVDYLRKIINNVLNEEYFAMCISKGMETCGNCRYKHICYDLFQLNNFLEIEKSYNYPHCSKFPSTGK